MRISLRFAITAVLAAQVLSCGGKVVVDETTSAPDGVAPDGGALCSRGEVGVDGNAGPLSFKVQSAAVRQSCATVHFGGSGLIQLASNESFETNGSVESSSGWVHLPDGATPGNWFCSGPTMVDVLGANAALGELRLSFEWSAPRAVGTCPGKPVDGAIAYSMSEHALSGELFGVTFEIFMSTSTETVGDRVDEDYSPGCGILEMHSAPGAMSFVLMPDDGPDPGALYCLGGIVGQTSDGFVDFGPISRLGRCDEAPAASGSLDVCYDL